MMDKNKKDIENFSLVLGGPLYQLLLRAHLIKPPVGLCVRRILFFLFITWLPLLILTMISGTAFGSVRIPFIHDIAIHARFFISLSLLIAAELSVHYQIKIIINQFIERNIIAPENKSAFDKIITSCMHLRDSVLAELLILILAFSAGPWIWKEFSNLNISTWYASITSHGPELTAAGYWCGFISLPIFQFLLLRWYYRLFIWYKFLWQISRLPLHLNSLHPDKAGGLGFLVWSVYAFAPVLLAHTALLAGIIANSILYADIHLSQVEFEIIGMILYLIFIIFLPLTFFSIHMLRTKRNGTYEYGVTASKYVDDFRSKWINSNSKTNEILLGTPDIQALSDLSNSFEVSNQMKLVPFTKGSLLKIILLTAVPFIPFIFTVIPLEIMINSVIKIVM